MFVPAMYVPRRAADVVELVRSNPMAIVASCGAQTPYATHAPVVLENADEFDLDADEPLADARFVGHMNRANQHWKVVGEGGRALLIFQGPNSYISPTYHELRPTAPTWDFMTVHVRGTIEALPKGKPSMDVITATVRELERAAGTGWDMTDSLQYFEKISPGAGIFRVRVESVEAMFKLSQEQPADVREAISAGVLGCPCPSGRLLSESIDRENQQPVGTVS